MNIDSFKVMLQETLDSMQACICMIADSGYIRSAVQDVSDYCSRIKDDATEIFQQFNSDMQYQCSSVFDEFMKKCNSIVDDSMELIRKNEIIKTLSNDIFYNDEPIVSV